MEGLTVCCGAEMVFPWCLALRASAAAARRLARSRRRCALMPARGKFIDGAADTGAAGGIASPAGTAEAVAATETGVASGGHCTSAVCSLVRTVEAGVEFGVGAAGVSSTTGARATVAGGTTKVAAGCTHAATGGSTDLGGFAAGAVAAGGGATGEATAT